MNKFNKRNTIIMKYPIIVDNPLCDGQEHTIKPTSLYTFNYNGRTLYYLIYEDITMRANAGTLLEREGNAFYKIPLRSYEEVRDILQEGDSKPVSLDILENITRIDTREPIDNISLIGSTLINKPPREDDRGRWKLPDVIMNGPRRQIEVFTGSDGYYYIRNIAACIIFGSSTISRDDKPAYRLTDEQFRFIQENFEIVWRSLMEVHTHVNPVPSTPSTPPSDPTPNNNNKPHSRYVRVYYSNNQEFYIRSEDARDIFGVEIDISNPYYALTAEQLLFLQRNYTIIWVYMKNKKEIPSINRVMGENDRFVRLANCLVGFAERSGLNGDDILTLFFPVKYVSLNCDDSRIPGGVIGYDGKLSGIKEFVEDNGGFLKLKNNKRGKYIDYLKGLIQNGGVVPVRDIHDYICENELYKFVGKWPSGPTVNHIEPLGIGKSKKDTLASCLLGYINSRCSGHYTDETFGEEIESDDINIKELRDRQKTITR